MDLHGKVSITTPWSPLLTKALTSQSCNYIDDTLSSTYSESDLFRKAPHQYHDSELGHFLTKTADSCSSLSPRKDVKEVIGKTQHLSAFDFPKSSSILTKPRHMSIPTTYRLSQDSHSGPSSTGSLDRKRPPKELVSSISSTVNTENSLNVDLEAHPSLFSLLAQPNPSHRDDKHSKKNKSSIVSSNSPGSSGTKGLVSSSTIGSSRHIPLSPQSGSSESYTLPIERLSWMQISPKLLNLMKSQKQPETVSPTRTISESKSSAKKFINEGALPKSTHSTRDSKHRKNAIDTQRSLEVHKRLFFQGQVRQLAKERWIKEELDFQKKLVDADCPFKPILSPSVDNWKRPAKYAPDRRLEEEMLHRYQRLLAQEEERVSRQLEECTFQPLTLRRAGLQASLSSHSDLPSSCHNYLYKHAVRQREFQDKFHEALTTHTGDLWLLGNKPCHSKVSKVTTKGNKSFLAPSGRKSSSNIRCQRALSSCTSFPFHPEINPTSEILVQCTRREPPIIKIPIGQHYSIPDELSRELDNEYDSGKEGVNEGRHIGQKRTIRPRLISDDAEVTPFTNSLHTSSTQLAVSEADPIGFPSENISRRCWLVKLFKYLYLVSNQQKFAELWGDNQKHEFFECRTYSSKNPDKVNEYPHNVGDDILNSAFFRNNYLDLIQQDDNQHKPVFFSKSQMIRHNISIADQSFPDNISLSALQLLQSASILLPSRVFDEMSNIIQGIKTNSPITMGKFVSHVLAALQKSGSTRLLSKNLQIHVLRTLEKTLSSVVDLISTKKLSRNASPSNDISYKAFQKVQSSYKKDQYARLKAQSLAELLDYSVRERKKSDAHS